MPSMRRLLVLATLLVGPALVAGCARTPKQSDMACPMPAIVDGAQSASYANTGLIPEVEDPSRVVYRATVLGFGGGCGHSGDDTVVRLILDLSAVAGPAYDGRPITFPYFVAVANPSGQIVDKQTFTASLPAPRSREAVGVQDMIEQKLQGVDRGAAPSWKIYVGLDMPRAAAEQRLNAR